MKEYEIIKCKTEQEVIELVSFFESVFSENNDIKQIKETSKLKQQMMIKNLNEDSYWLCYIKNGSNIIAGIIAIIAGDILYLDVLAVDKNYRNNGISKLLFDFILNNSKSVINSIIVYPDKFDKDKSFDYYISTGFKPILELSCFRNIDFEEYNKYNFDIYESNINTFNDNDVTKYYSKVKYYIDNPKDEYTTYYENLIPDVEWCYMFVKTINKSKDMNTKIRYN